MAPACGLFAQERAKKPKVDPYADAKFVAGPPSAIAKGSFTIAVLPDTQHYSEKYPENFLAQTRWIMQERKARNIAAVMHLGDITNRSTPAEWKNASKAMSVLDGRMPYFLSTGNHDYSEGGVCKDRVTRMSEYFPVGRFCDRPGFVAVYDKEPKRTENSCHTFSAGGRDFLTLALEFGPRKDVVRWANEMADRHAKREIILITHAYMYNDDTRHDWVKYRTSQSWNPHNYSFAKATDDDVSDGEELWKNLVCNHKNFILTLNGHVLGDGLGRATTATPDGRQVTQSLVNFQMKPKGGDGWLRLMEFHSDGTTVDVVDYSPTRNQQNVSGQNAFQFKTSNVG